MPEKSSLPATEDKKAASPTKEEPVVPKRHHQDRMDRDQGIANEEIKETFAAFKVCTYRRL